MDVTLDVDVIQDVDAILDADAIVDVDVTTTTTDLLSLAWIMETTTVDATLDVDARWKSLQYSDHQALERISVKMVETDSIIHF